MEEELIEILGSELLDGDTAIDRETDLFAAGLDSMGIMQLILAIEDRFGTTIDPSELSRDNFATIRRIASLISSKQASGGAEDPAA